MSPGVFDRRNFVSEFYEHFVVGASVRPCVTLCVCVCLMSEYSINKRRTRVAEKRICKMCFMSHKIKDCDKKDYRPCNKN